MAKLKIKSKKTGLEQTVTSEVYSKMVEMHGRNWVILEEIKPKEAPKEVK